MGLVLWKAISIQGTFTNGLQNDAWSVSPISSYAPPNF